MQSSPQTFRQCETYWCEPDPADTIGSEQQGDRIWLIVSLRSRYKVVVAVPLSRHIDKAVHPFLITVPASEITTVDGTTPVDRVALADQIRTLDKSRLRKKSGEISKIAFRSVLGGIDYMLGKASPQPNSN
jgi:mRNA-degrading endonuclease toxin of MazEF toxin-antitoxin module